MSRNWFHRGLSALAILVLIGLGAARAWAQQGTVGTVTITVVDQSGGIVSAAHLDLRDIATNDVRSAETQDRGTYSFVGLSVGTYQLTVSKSGFDKQVFESVIVHAAQVTDVNVSLKVGVTTETVEVHESEVPLIDTTSNAIGTTIDMKQIEDLPLSGRDLSGLANLTPGTASVAGIGPTWNGLPVMAQGNNIDGVIANTSRMKFSGNYAAPSVSARIEDMSEMTVQTDQLDLDQGFGQANMQINFVTRRGSNSFHGRAFEDFQNSYLNANSWTNDAGGTPKPHYELNDFGGSIGGPILRDKLFFFGTYAESKQPGSIIGTNRVLTAAAQAGVFTYTGSDNASHTVCLFTAGCPGGGTGIVDAYNAAHPGANYGTNFPTSNAAIQQELNNINTAALPLGKSLTTSDPVIDGFQWALPSPSTTYFPTVRIDYNMSQSLRFNFAWNMTRYSQPNVNPPTFPGTPFDGQGTGNFTRYYTTAFGFDWTIKPTLVNQFRGGFLYYFQGYGDLGFNNIETQYPTVAWNIVSPEVYYPYGGNMSGQQYSLPTPDYYPLFNASDTVTWQHGAHSLNFGFSWYREQDHYWNAPAGYAGYSLATSSGLATGDPALNMFTTSSVPAAGGQNLSEIESLYATLAGRVSGVGGQFAYSQKTGQYATTCCSAYNLDELSRAWGLFIQDSWRIKQNLTLNYGLRWDFTGDNHDLTSAYHSVPPDSLFGPSGVGNLFNPGSLTGNMNPEYVANGHAYNPWNITPQPSIGIAWSPGFSEGFLGKVAGGGTTVIRAGFSLRDFIEPYQYFWDYATDQGQFYYQNFQLISGNAGSNPTGYYQPGSLNLGDTLPTYIYTPPAYATTYPMANTTFTFFPAWGMDPNIKQPYTESWNIGIQRQLGQSNAIEIRYVGNRAVHQWIGLNINEVNIFGANGSDPSFVNQFKTAQTNLALNNGLPSADPYHGTFAYNSAVSGEGPLPLFDAAFAGESGAPLADYSNSQFINWLQQGQAGAFGAAMASPFGTANYYCNLVGSSFGPCANNLGYTGAGAGYPINFFQANPYNEGSSANYLTAGGYSTYNALQIDFRQKQWHGMQFDVNYTWSHNLGLQTRNDWEGVIDNGYTLRNLKLSYAPTLYDLRHTVHAGGTYDLPFGVGKQFLNRTGFLDRVVGGWTVGTIFTFQTGSPFNLIGGFKTFNDYGDGGVVLSGVTTSQLQSAVGVYENGTVTPSLLNPSFVSSAISSGSIAANQTPGVIAPPIWLHGPHTVNDDIAITKFVPIRENIRFSLQGEFLNAFNHPNFGNYGGYALDTGVQDGGFGTVYGTLNSSRAIELRANLEF
ncbi:MAG TPA: carboxypeptidase-like regulatory domain-containing protein [Candidatus Limnocylindrales bacterium]|nr:carboxypeptidase-like regulatory domain-containing protein [Candidatus Limnocylindrales bacterium]